MGRMAQDSTLAMGMNIKDARVHAMARQLAARNGTTVTEAVRQALGTALARGPELDGARARSARKAAIREICARFREQVGPLERTGRELQQALYGANGLPL